MFKPPGGGLQVNKLNGRINVFIIKFHEFPKNCLDVGVDIDVDPNWSLFRPGAAPGRTLG